LLSSQNSCHLSLKTNSGDITHTTDDICFHDPRHKPSCFNVLLQENVLYLPSTTISKKVTWKLHSSTEVGNLPYLKLHVSKLNEFKQSVLLIIDEIYVAWRVEYNSGEVSGLTADGNVSSKLLCFMVQSVASKYKDIVAIYATNRLHAMKHKECYDDVTTLQTTASLPHQLMTLPPTANFTSTACAMAHSTSASSTQFLVNQHFPCLIQCILSEMCTTIFKVGRMVFIPVTYLESNSYRLVDLYAMPFPMDNQRHHCVDVRQRDWHQQLRYLHWSCRTSATQGSIHQLYGQARCWQFSRQIYNATVEEV